MSEGRALAADGQAKALAAENPQWVAHAHAVIDEFIAKRVRFTAEDIRNRCGDPDRANAVGGLIKAYQQAGLIQQVGFTEAGRRSRRGGALRVWQAPRRRNI